jgi:hypothetical protein
MQITRVEMSWKLRALHPSHAVCLASRCDAASTCCGRTRTSKHATTADCTLHRFAHISSQQILGLLFFQLLKTVTVQLMYTALKKIMTIIMTTLPQGIQRQTERHLKCFVKRNKPVTNHFSRSLPTGNHRTDVIPRTYVCGGGGGLQKVGTDVWGSGWRPVSRSSSGSSKKYTQIRTQGLRTRTLCTSWRSVPSLLLLPKHTHTHTHTHTHEWTGSDITRRFVAPTGLLIC